MKDAIGVIGGMGPLASQLFYKMITEHTAAECDQDHVPLLILSDVRSFWRNMVVRRWL